MNEFITVRGARANNLKNVNLTIPRDKLVVFTGLSGSGKSSLAFDTIYAEGQRRYVESLSSYARMFLGQMDKPDVDAIDGLSPAISIDQKTTSKNPRSTVGTVTEIYDYLRLLWARTGVPHCPNCGREIRKQTIDQIVDKILQLPEGTRFQVLSPAVRGKKGEHQKVFSDARKSGFARVRVDGNLYDLTEEIALDKNKKHDIELVVDRLVLRGDVTRRLTDSIETATSHGGGLALIQRMDTQEELPFSLNYACEDCGISMPELSPRMFSFNNPYGACPHCAGLGFQLKVDPDLIIPNRSLSILEGGIQASGWGNVRNDSISKMYFDALAEKFHFKLTDPIETLPKEGLDAILYGTKGEKLKLYYERANGRGTLEQAFEGIVPSLERRYRETQSDAMRKELEECMSTSPCPECGGKRLSPISRAVTVGGMKIMDYCDLPVTRALDFMERLELPATETMIAAPILREIKARLGFLRSVGLQYLTLSRAAATLSGGESQRINLVTALGSSLVGSMYILDEPSIGLHPRDTERLISVLKRLRDIGNTVIVVEHDEEIIRAADQLIDMGPRAGLYGGEVIYVGKAADATEEQKDRSLTLQYLDGLRKRYVRERRPWQYSITVEGAHEHNLKGIDVKFPLGVLTVVTGVSGSGKSSLVGDILYPALYRRINESGDLPGVFKGLSGNLDRVQRVEYVDQNPIGRSSRSNAVTYLKAFDNIRDLFASQQYAKINGFKPEFFSFNADGGRCPECQGDGYVKIEMQFMADVTMVCEECGGKRFKPEVLEVRYRGKNIDDVLNMSVDEAIAFFSEGEEPDAAEVARKLQPLQDVGLGYIKLGQSSSTLSGGESQRVKLAYFLSLSRTNKKSEKMLFIFDEPTTGLHFYDVEKLLKSFDALLAAGHSLIVVEHNPDVIRSADWIIDLGPDAGDRGGEVVFEGTPEDLLKADTFTARYI